MAVPLETALPQDRSQQPNASTTTTSSAAATTAAPLPMRPKLARAPLWARLPPLHASGSTNATGSSLAASPARASPIAPPPIVLPDRVGTTRVLLQDAQSTMQKFAARMDTIGANIEQALKEVQLARSSIDVAGEKTIAELTDTIRNCQTFIAKKIESQDSAVDKLSDKIDRLIGSNESMLKLYETHTSSLGSVIQSLHNHSNLLQTLQDQQVRILTSISPIEPLIKSIPMHFDASQNSHHTRILPALESSIEKAVLHGIKPFFSRIAITGTEPHPSYLVPGSPPEQSERGQKRRLGERDDHPSDSVNSPPHRPSSMTATAHTRSATKIRAHGNVYSSSPLAVRRRSSVWTPTHLQRRASNRHLSSKAAPADEARNDNLTAALNEAQAPATPSRSFRPSSILHRSSARPPAGLGCASRHVSLSVESSRTRSQVHIGGVIVPSSAKRPSAIEAEKNAVPARITRFFTKPFEALDVQNDAAPLNEVTASTDPEPASPTPDALNQSRNGPQIERTRPIDVSIEPSAVKAPELVTTEGAAGTTSVSKNNKKTKRVSKPSKAKAKGSNDKSKKGGKDKKGKKVPGTGPPDLGNAGSSRADEIVDGAKEPNAKRQKTTASDTTTATETSGVSEHGPPNSPSRPTSIIDLSRQSRSPSSVIRATPSLIDLSSTRYTTRLGITTKAKPSPLEAQTPLRRRLIDIRNSSACTEEDDGAAVSLAAALAHVTSDVNFMNSDNMTNSRLIPTEVDDCLTKGALGLNFPGELPTSDATFVTSSSGIGSGIISHPQSGRSKRYLVADDSTTIDLLFDDDLLDE